MNRSRIKFDYSVDHDPEGCVQVPGIHSTVGTDSLVVTVGAEATVFGLSPNFFLQDTVSAGTFNQV